MGGGLDPPYQLNQHTGDFGGIFLSTNLTQGFLGISIGGGTNTFFSSFCSHHRVLWRVSRPKQSVQDIWFFLWGNPLNLMSRKTEWC